jgi:hypothetical protein
MLFCSPSFTPFSSNKKGKAGKKPSLFLDVTNDEEDEIPWIQQLASLSVSPSSSPSLLRSTKSRSPPSSTRSSSSYIDSNYYISQEDANDCMLAPDVVHELHILEYPEGESNKEDNEKEALLRRSLIHEELTTLIQLAQDQEDNEYEFESEAVEALGVAANQLAYRKKHYLVNESRYMYVPSVAYTIMNGALLELAQDHYYGRSEEFLIQYAGSLGSAILSQQDRFKGKYLSTEKNISNDLLERVHTSHDEQTPRYYKEDKAQVMKLVWGVTPKQTVSGTFTFEDNTMERKDRRKERSRQSFGRALFLMTVLIGAVVSTFLHYSTYDGSEFALVNTFVLSKIPTVLQQQHQAIIIKDSIHQKGVTKEKTPKKARGRASSTQVLLLDTPSTPPTQDVEKDSLVQQVFSFRIPPEVFTSKERLKNNHSQNTKQENSKKKKPIVANLLY